MVQLDPAQKQVAQLPMETIGRQMNIAGGPSEAPFPKNIGLMMFSEHPEKFFPVTQIDVVYFPDGPGGDIFEEKEFKGPLHRMIRDALSHIQRNYLKQTVIKHPHRAEADRIWNYPYAAIEEALVNAIYHRSYEIREPVEVRITPEELLILSFPGPDRSITMADIAAGNAVSRRYRNRRIGEFMKELELTEGRSTGIRKIKRAIAKNGSPDPIFETDDDRSYFLVRFPVHPDAIRSAKVEQVTGQVTGQVERWKLDVLTACIEPKKSTEIQEIIGIKHRETFQRNYLDILLEQGLLARTILDNPRSRFQRYQITEQGQTFLRENNNEKTGRVCTQ